MVQVLRHFLLGGAVRNVATTSLSPLGPTGAPGGTIGHKMFSSGAPVARSGGSVSDAWSPGALELGDSANLPVVYADVFSGPSEGSHGYNGSTGPTSRVKRLSGEFNSLKQSSYDSCLIQVGSVLPSSSHQRLH